MEYKGAEYSVVRLTGGIGWRWEIRLGDGNNQSGVIRAAAVKQAKQEIDCLPKSGK